MQNMLITYRNIKPGYMPQLKLNQIQYEVDLWKRKLGFMGEENIYQKNRLIEILRNKFDISSLNEAEDFQTRFIKEDELIELLRNELAELDKLLVREIFEDGKIAKEIDPRVKKFRNNIASAEIDFSKLKSEFNNYLSENIFSDE